MMSAMLLVRHARGCPSFVLAMAGSIYRYSVIERGSQQGGGVGTQTIGERNVRDFTCL